ncbi:helix-turn-helix domain-containing protein [bacterium]|nr:helix-turn-helix domain-containing protein [bacterium]
MKEVVIFVPKGEIILSSVIGPFKIFSKVNDLLGDRGPFYNIRLAGLDRVTNLYGGHFSINMHCTIAEVAKADLVVIPAVFGDFKRAVELNSEATPWFKTMHERGAEMASLCMGAFLLAPTGILDGKSCTTHWLGAEAFRTMYPQVKLAEQKVITDENGVYTSGGAYSFLNLILHLVEKYNGRDMALMCAKIFEVDIDRDNQAMFSIFQGQKEHEDEPIINAQRFIENNYSDKIYVDKLAEMFALSRRNFIRRFKKATANSPIEYIQRVRVEAAKRSLESSNQTINEVMYTVGYSDSKAFRNTFRKFTGVTPKGYKQKYNRVRAMN